MSKKTKVWVYADAPSVATGFGTVSRNILEALHRTGRYDIEVFGINHHGDPTPNFPYNIWPAGTGSNDPYGRQKFCQMTARKEFDILFLLQDTFIMDFMPELLPHLTLNRPQPCKSICYFPIDGVPKPEWIKNINYADVRVAYTEFGKQQAKEQFPEVGEMRVIPHGANLRDFTVLPKDQVEGFKKQFFGTHADKFIIMNLNRNQQRKDIPRTIQAFVEFKKQVPESILYLHMAQKDQGWNLTEVCRAHGLSTSTDVIFPENFGPNQGYPVHIVNALYNCADVLVSTTLGEGFGLSWLEAMATKTPVLMPDNTMFGEFITEDKGYLSKSGTNPSLLTVLPNDNEVIRPLVDVEDMVAKLLRIYNNRDEAKAKAEVAYKWIQKEMDWQGAIAKQWVTLFDETAASLKSPAVKLPTGPAGNKVINAEMF